VRVTNVAPIAELGNDRTGVEGDLFTFNPIRIDPGVADTFHYSWSAYRPNGTLLTNNNNTIFTFIPPDNGTYTIRLNLTDDDGGEWNDSVNIIAANAQPLAFLGADKSGSEGTPVSVTPVVTDDGSADTFTYNWTVYKPDNSVGWTYSTTTLSFLPPDNGIYRIVLTVTDDDGGTGSDEMFVQVLNQPPALSFAGNGGAFVNVPYQVSLSVSDPGADTISSWTINWNDGSAVQTIQGSLGPITHVYTTLAAGIPITGSATDEDGTYNIPIRLINVVPATTLMADGTLLIAGTTQNDTLSISVNSASNTLQATLDGAVVEYPLANVARFEASLGAGNDTTTFLTSGVPSGIVRGEDGNDTMTISAPLSSPIQFLGGNSSAFLDVLNVNAGAYTFTSDPRVGTGRLSVNLNAASVVFNTTAHLEALVLANGSRATIAPNGSRYLRLISISIGGGSVVDLTNNDLIMQPVAANAASVASNISFLLRQAYNAPTRWQDASLTSSSARADASRTLGFMRNLGPKYTTFDGETVDVNSTLVAYTVVGDLNLDRSVSISDFVDLAANFGKTSTSWITGDMNYDQRTTIADFIDLAGHFGETLSPPAPVAVAPMSAADLQVESTDSAVSDNSSRRKRRSSDDLPPARHHRPHHRRHTHHPAPRFARRAD
jgi:hypothetical protein